MQEARVCIFNAKLHGEGISHGPINICKILYWGCLGHFTHEIEARDHSTSSALIGRKGGAGPSSLHTTLEGPTA